VPLVGAERGGANGGSGVRWLRPTEVWGTNLLELGWSGDVEGGVNRGDSESEGDNKRLCEHF